MPPTTASAAASSQNPTLIGLRRRHAPAIIATDGERLMRFQTHRDEAAFREVVDAHAALVWGVCWQVLRHRQDVEDAFQATFLILAQKGGAIRASDSAAGWLYRVAFRTALAARQRRRRLGVDPLSDDPPGTLEDQLASIERSEQCEALLEELHALGDRYRQPLVLCYLEGRSRQEAADELGVTMASVKGRLARGLRLLRTRLASRGLTLSSAAALLTTEMAAAQASVAAAPVLETAALGASFAWAAPTVGAKSATAGSAAAGAITLANKGILAMKLAAAAKPALGLLAIGMTAGAIAIAKADPPRISATIDGAVVELVAGSSTGELAPPPTGEAADVDASLDFVATEPGGATVPVEPQVQVTAAVEEAEVTEAAIELLAETRIDVSEEVEDVLVQAPQPQPVPVVMPYPPTQPGPSPYAAPRLDDVAPRLHAISLAPALEGLFRAAAASTPGDGGALELELEYWTLKGRGLQKKSEALRSKSRALAQSGAGTQIEVLELEAEADLSLAEVKLCEARAHQVKVSLERLQQGEPSAQQSGDVEMPTSGNIAQLVPATPPPAARIGAAVTPPAIAVRPMLNLVAPVPAAPAAQAVSPQAPGTAAESVYPSPPAAAASPNVALQQLAAIEAQRAAAEAQYAELRKHIAELQAANAELHKQLEALRSEGAAAK